MDSTKSKFEPAEFMYPVDTEKLHFTKHPTIWQARAPFRSFLSVGTSIGAHDEADLEGQYIFFEATTAEEAFHRTKCLLGDSARYRRLPIASLKKKAGE